MNLTEIYHEAVQRHRSLAQAMWNFKVERLDISLYTIEFKLYNRQGRLQYRVGQYGISPHQEVMYLLETKLEQSWIPYMIQGNHFIFPTGMDCQRAIDLLLDIISLRWKG